MANDHDHRLDHERLYACALEYARRATKSKSLARELVHEAFVRLKTTRSWDPSTQPSLERHVLGIVKSLLWTHRTTARPRYERDAGREHQLLAGGAAASAEAMSMARSEQEEREAEAARQVDTLRAGLEGNELHLTICDLLAEDVTKPAALAERTGRPITEIHVALRRIRRHALRIAAPAHEKDLEVS